MQDHYETLQVHPRADADAIRAAYERLRERYSPARLEGAADELQELARRRRDEIERAYTVLADPERRRAYDAELAERAVPAPRGTAPAHGAAEARATPDDDELIDYRPLPPARRQERPPGFNAQPMLPPSQARSAGRAVARTALPPWVPPTLIVAAAIFAIVLVTLITTALSAPTAATGTGGPQSLDPSAPTAVATADVNAVINQFEGRIVAARQVAEQVPENANAWIELGNALYDSVVVVRERVVGGDQSLQGVYVQRLPRWLEAAEAYRRATELQPQDPVARADLAASLCFYGEGVNDQSYVQQGLAEAEQAISDGPEEPRALLSKGLCLAVADPPQLAEALEQWQRLVVLPGADPGIVFQARQLIAEYGQ
jgi:curved DNA-binding protein CbpA